MPRYIKANGDEGEEIKDLSLEMAQKLVGGYVEVVSPKLTPGVVILVNEDGLRLNLPINPVGTGLYGDTIVGDIIILTKKEARLFL